MAIATAPVGAVILYGTGDPGANTTAPTGTLAGSGWQYEGKFGGFLGTVIASNYFITAKHIGGSVGQIFTFNGVDYTTTAVFPDPSSDLQIWQVAGAFPIKAPIYSSAAGSEVNLGLVVFGRGRQRSSPVNVGTDSHLGGWLWGTLDAVERWGTNVVGSIYTDPGVGNLLRAPFNASAGGNEAHLAVGDSGGAVFIFNSTTNAWELAGINYGVDGMFSTAPSGTNPFNAAMFDTTGLFAQQGNGTWAAAPNPSAFYATEIAAHKGFIESVVMQLTKVVSRKIHPGAGTFDVTLPESGAPGIECRSGGQANNYTVVFMFANSVSVQRASVTAGAGSVTSFSVSGKNVTVELTGVTNAQTIVVTLANANDGVNTSNVQATMGVLLGDVNATGLVDGNDVSAVQAHTRQTANSANFVYDVNTTGLIDGNDVSLVQSKTRTSLPPPSGAEKSKFHVQPLPGAATSTRSPGLPTIRPGNP
jgi:hypothetical protein